MEFICPRCHYVAKQKRLLWYHLNRVKPCKNEFSSETPYSILDRLKFRSDLPVKCPTCPQSFHTKQGLYHHYKNKKCQAMQRTAPSTTEATHTQAETLAETDHSSSVASTSMQDVVMNEPAIISSCQRKQTEDVYQKILERHLGGTHQYLRIGVTDITTDMFHAEIKEWSCYKEAIGQLMCYNCEDPRLELRLYLFGKEFTSQLSCMLAACKQLRIRVFSLSKDMHNLTIKSLSGGATEYVPINVIKR